MEQYETPEVEVIVFETEDVIVTSGKKRQDFEMPEMTL